MARGGARNGAGRPAGATNKRTQKREAAMAEAAKAVEGAIAEAFSGDAHALLMAVYKDPSRDMALRVDAAKAAIRYEKPALSSIEANLSVSNHEAALDELA
jgi:hypothetical protein